MLTTDRGQFDYQKAMEWFQKSASQGYADAQYNIGIRLFYRTMGNYLIFKKVYCINTGKE